jgi:hypothetical protein
MALLMIMMTEPLYYENHTKPANTLYVQEAVFFLLAKLMVYTESLSFKRLSLQPSEV